MPRQKSARDRGRLHNEVVRKAVFYLTTNLADDSEFLPKASYAKILNFVF
jgi:hypothetical protein